MSYSRSFLVSTSEIFWGFLRQYEGVLGRHFAILKQPLTVALSCHLTVNKGLIIDAFKSRFRAAYLTELMTEFRKWFKWIRRLIVADFEHMLNEVKRLIWQNLYRSRSDSVWPSFKANLDYIKGQLLTGFCPLNFEGTPWLCLGQSVIGHCSRQHLVTGYKGYCR